MFKIIVFTMAVSKSGVSISTLELEEKFSSQAACQNVAAQVERSGSGSNYSFGNSTSFRAHAACIQVR